MLYKRERLCRIYFFFFLQNTTHEFIKLKFANHYYKHIEGKLYLCEKNFSYGLFAYYIKPSTALKWLKHLKKMYYPVDFYTDMFYIHKVPQYIYVEENLSLQAPENEITSIGAIQKISLISKIIRPLWKFYWHLRLYIFKFKQMIFILPQHLKKMKS